MPVEKMNTQILVVEDELSLAELLEYFLLDLGYEVLIASNGQRALEVLENQSVGLIISDVMMPVLDGYQFVKELRTTPKLAGIPVLLISAAPINSSKLKPHEAQAYLNKPYELDKMEEVVEHLAGLPR